MTFDFRNPDYVSVFQERIERLQELRADPVKLAALKIHYGHRGVADFIDDWGVTFDPRNGRNGKPSLMPFKLFGRQREWVEWFLQRLDGDEDGLTEKSRDMGITWLAVAVASTLCLFNSNLVFSFGSRKETLVDKAGDPDCIFWKARQFISLLPPEFRGMWNAARDSSHMKIEFPETRSIIRGEAGDNIGRGGRATAAFTDEDAFIPRLATVDAALSQTTNCRIRLSTVNGRGNTFAVARHSGRVPVFTFHWSSDPRKDQAWYERQKERLDPIILAQEIDINYDASTKGQILPAEWVRAALDAHIVLGLNISGEKRGAQDVADEGPDKNAFAGKYGILLNYLDQWSGKGSDTYETTEKAFEICRMFGYEGFDFDSDGLGVAMRGDARVINERQANESGLPPLDVQPWRGSGAVVDPEDMVPQVDEQDDDPLHADRKNMDFFANAKAQGWWNLRIRFQRTFRAVKAAERGEALSFDPDSLISISSTVPYKDELLAELSQPTWKMNDTGKMVVIKADDNEKSPNLADAVMMLYAPKTRHMSIFQALNQRR